MVKKEVSGSVATASAWYLVTSPNPIAIGEGQKNC